MDTTTVNRSLLLKYPKTVLHLHIEGTLEPELMFYLAKKNNIPISFKSVSELINAYDFSNLQSFLDMYYMGCNVLITEDDFYELTLAYFTKVKSQNVKHVELFFDPQTHTTRGVLFETVLKGIKRAQLYAKENLNISSYLIMCFLRHLSQEEAFTTLEEAIKYKDQIIGIGLDSGEQGNPPTKFVEVYEKAKENGFRLVAHAGEEGPPQNIWDAIEKLNCERIDHGVTCLKDDKLVDFLAEKKIPLTCCPLSNQKLKVFKDLKEWDQEKMLKKGVIVTINSDDPAYFGGYCLENFHALIDGGLVKDDQTMKRLVSNGFVASFLPDVEKESLLKEVDDIYNARV